MNTVNPIPVPVCGGCNQTMRCDKNSVLVKGPSPGGLVPTFWSGDRYKCNECSSTVIVGFGRGFQATNERHARYLDAIEIS